MPDDMTAGEVARRLEDVVREVRGVSDKMLLREVYDAQRGGLESRIKAIEDDRINGRRLIYGLAGTFVITTIGQLLLQLIAR